MFKFLITVALCGLAINGGELVTEYVETETECAYVEETETEYVDETETEYVQTYTDEELDVLSRIISAEAGNCSWEMMEDVGSVVLNRVASPKFPNTIYDVVFQTDPVQYSPTINGAYWNTPTDGAIEVAKYLLENGSCAPPDVLYQANFPQGTGTWKTLSTSYSTMYFCYG